MSSAVGFCASCITQSIVLYVGMCTVIVGVSGNLLNLLIFLSLKTFRENSCAFYLVLMSLVNIGHLITGQLTRVVITGFGMDWTSTSLFYCKFRQFSVQAFGLVSLTCLCLATMDQFFATCFTIYWQQWSNIRLAHRLSALAIVIWVLYCTPYLVFYDQVFAASGPVSCSLTNIIFRQYHTYVNNVALSCGLPLVITVTLGTLAYRNVRQIAYRTVPLVRRELDKQLTNMVLIQIIFSFCFLLPYFILLVISLATNITSDPVTNAYFNIFINISACIYYFTYACPFYIYVCVSKRFRQQLVYALCNLRFNPKQRTAPNRILPLQP
ncbi:unnamed protein product [Adineta ricciae]|uniref:G-protein coupled receptors family 1 profile domain-containing protein n=1 Tax=Adineta ricciae TaxID=249248 RepID=A0A814E4C3_ADIRI|nr:unnamed protein product [Adineta ricciae]